MSKACACDHDLKMSSSSARRHELDQLRQQRLQVVGALLAQVAVAEDLEEELLPLPQLQRLVQRNVEQQDLPSHVLELPLQHEELELPRRMAPQLRYRAEHVAYVTLAARENPQRRGRAIPVLAPFPRRRLLLLQRRCVLDVEGRGETPKDVGPHALQRAGGRV
jgi:hypothetical protein